MCQPRPVEEIDLLTAANDVVEQPMVGFEEISEPPDDYEYPRPLLPANWEETDEGQIPPEGAGSVRMSPQKFGIKAHVRASFGIVK